MQTGRATELKQIGVCFLAYAVQYQTLPWCTLSQGAPYFETKGGREECQDASEGKEGLADLQQACGHLETVREATMIS